MIAEMIAHQNDRRVLKAREKNSLKMIAEMIAH